MSTALSPMEEEASEEALLLRDVRDAGDTEAYAELYRRHYDAALRLASALTRGRIHAAEDLVEEGFTSTFAALKAGAGPQVALRPYLYASIRNAAAAHAKREQPVIDVASFEPYDVPSIDDYSVVEETLDQTTIGGAFLGLPSSWQNALWFVEVEQLDVADAAPLLELSPNAVSSLLGRAREGLKRRYLQQHVAEPVRLDCRRVSSKLGSYVRDGLTAKDDARVRKHLESCESCEAAVLSLRDIGAALRAVIFPATIGTGAATALGLGLAAGGGAGTAQASTASAGASSGGSSASGGSAAGSSGGVVGGIAAAAAAVMSVIGAVPVWAIGAVAAVLIAGTTAAFVIPAVSGGPAEAAAETGAEQAAADAGATGGAPGGSAPPAAPTAPPPPSAAPSDAPADDPAQPPAADPGSPNDQSDPAPPADDATTDGSNPPDGGVTPPVPSTDPPVPSPTTTPTETTPPTDPPETSTPEPTETPDPEDCEDLLNWLPWCPD